MRGRRLTIGARAAGPAVALALAPLSASLGQDDFGPTVINPQQELDWFHLEDVRLAFVFDYRGEIDDVDPQIGPGTRDIEHRFREILEIETESFIGHPNLLELDASGRFGLTQRIFDFDSGEGGSDTTHETLLEYDIQALFLKKQDVPFTLYTRRTDQDVGRQFGGSLESVTEEHGVRAQLRSDEFPTFFTYFHRTRDEDDPTFDASFNLKQDTVLIDGQIDTDVIRDLAWDYEFTDVDETGENRSTQSFQRHEFNLLHTLYFGEDDRNSLRSTFRYYDETGDIEFNQIRVNETLRFRPSIKLTHWYDFIGEWNERETQEQNLLRGSANVRHQLFESLTTIAQVGALQLEIPTDDFTSEQYFGDASLEYTKRVPLGRFNAGVSGRYSTVDESSRGAPIDVPDNLRVFGPDDRITLQGQNILPDSIRVLDASGTILYSEGIDYTLQVFADRVEIIRRLGGNIAPGQAVRIDYTIGPEPANETDTFGWSVSARYTFAEGPLRGLAGYVRYSEQNESRTTFDFIDDPDFTPFPEQDYEELLYGLEYNVWKLDLRAERRIRDSTLSPFESTRLEATYTEELGRGSRFVANAFYDEVDNTDEGFVTESVTLTGGLSATLSPRLTGDLRLTYRHTENNQGSETDAFEQYVDLRWEYRQTELFARLRNSILEDNASDRMFTTIYVGLRREF